jgi:hypothetical protein
VQSAILAFFFFFFPFASCSLASEMILFSQKTEGHVGCSWACHSLRGLEFQCYKNGDEQRCSDSLSGLQV